MRACDHPASLLQGTQDPRAFCFLESTLEFSLRGFARTVVLASAARSEIRELKPQLEAPEERITARSITFCNSRILPGQG